MQQRHGYSKAVLTICGCASPPTAPGEAEENIVAAAFAHYIAKCESADRARCPAALRRPAASSASCRRAGPQRQAMQIV
jgi:hypothetical protein